MSDKPKQERVLLPSNVLPETYHIHLSPNFSTFKCHGSEQIDLVVAKKLSTNTITLHALDMEILKDSIVLVRHKKGSPSEKVEFSVQTVSNNEEEETFSFEFGGEAFDIGEKLQLRLKFVGNVRDGAAGFYQLKYTTLSGETRYGGTTQFEAVDARKAFPCFDEPALKAVFNMKLTVPSYQIALSNMPVTHEDEAIGDESTKMECNPSNKFKTFTYDSSPKMSTYLVCFVVGEFDHLETKSSSGTTVRVYTPLGKKDQGTFALETATKTLDFYHDFFKIGYPLPKLDLIAISNMGGAMENWGLITFRDRALICDSKHASITQKMLILVFITHEIGHQWFGNLVTMQWWSELWLNEGFASWVETLAAHHLHPEWNIWTDYCRGYLAGGLSLDAITSTHPIEVDVAKSRDVDEIFDNISYNKGSAVIRMLASWLGMKKFAEGLHLYLSKFSYKNASASDLWASLSEASHLNVAKMMNNWITKEGYPVIFIDSIDGDKKLKFRQQRFLAHGKPTPEQDQTTWDIKLSFQTKHIDTTADQSLDKLPPSDPKSLFAGVSMIEFDQKEHIMDFDVTKCKWFKANSDATGFFRIVYGDSLFQKIKSGFRTNDFGATDRWSIIADAFATSLAGLMPISSVLSLLDLYKYETNHIVWDEIVSYLDEFSIIFSPCKEISEKLHTFTLNLLRPIVEKLGWHSEGATELQEITRPTTFQTLALADEHSSAASECKNLFTQLVSNPNCVKSVNWSLVMDVASAYGDKEVQEKLKAIYLDPASDLDLANRALMAIGFTKNEYLLKEALQWAFTDDKVVTSHLGKFIYGATSHNLGRTVVWEFVEKNFDLIQKRCQHGPFLFTAIIEASGAFSTSEYAARLEKLYSSTSVTGVDRTVAQVIEKIKLRESIRKQSEESVLKWLNEHVN